MLWRISQLFSGGGDLLKAEAEIAAKRMRRVAITGVVVAIGLLAALIGLLIALAGAAVALAAEIGWAGSLAVVGAFVLILGIAIALAARKKKIDEEPPAKGFHMPPEVEATHAKSQMRDAVDPHEHNPNEPHAARQQAHAGSLPDFNAIKDKVVDFAAKNPAAVASGAFLALSIIGPFRTFKMITRGAALAGMAATAVEHLKDAKNNADHKPGHSRTGHDPYAAQASAAGVSHATAADTAPGATTHRATGAGVASSPGSVTPRAEPRPEPKGWSGARPGAAAPGRDRV